MNNLLLNWKTTICGVMAIIFACVSLYNGWCGYGESIGSFMVGIGLILGKDHDAKH